MFRIIDSYSVWQALTGVIEMHPMRLKGYPPNMSWQFQLAARERAEYSEPVIRVAAKDMDRIPPTFRSSPNSSAALFSPRYRKSAAQLCTKSQGRGRRPCAARW
jgi:hypothetical protein